MRQMKATNMKAKCRLHSSQIVVNNIVGNFDVGKKGSQKAIHFLIFVRFIIYLFKIDIGIIAK
jgi:hypothetical protein